MSGILLDISAWVLSNGPQVNHGILYIGWECLGYAVVNQLTLKFQWFSSMTVYVWLMWSVQLTSAGVLFHVVTQGPKEMDAYHVTSTVAVSGEARAEETHIGFKKKMSI